MNRMDVFKLVVELDRDRPESTNGQFHIQY